MCLTIYWWIHVFITYKDLYFSLGTWECYYSTINPICFSSCVTRLMFLNPLIRAVKRFPYMHLLDIIASTFIAFLGIDDYVNRHLSGQIFWNTQGYIYVKACKKNELTYRCVHRYDSICCVLYSSLHRIRFTSKISIYVYTYDILHSSVLLNNHVVVHKMNKIRKCWY